MDRQTLVEVADGDDAPFGASPPITILALPGSLRQASYNRLVVRSLPSLAPAGMRFEVFEGSGNIPLYNEDLDHDDPPPPVAELRHAVSRADALFWAMPEYNHTIPSVTKNVIEWISHPLSKAALMGKISAIAVASKGRGGYRGLADLARVLRDLGGHVVAAPEVCIPFAHQAIRVGDDGGVSYADERTEALLRLLLLSLDDAVRARAGGHSEAPWRAFFSHAIGRHL
jgi:chromate reductase